MKGYRGRKRIAAKGGGCNRPGVSRGRLDKAIQLSSRDIHIGAVVFRESKGGRNKTTGNWEKAQNQIRWGEWWGKRLTERPQADGILARPI